MRTNLESQPGFNFHETIRTPACGKTRKSQQSFMFLTIEYSSLTCKYCTTQSPAWWYVFRETTFITKIVILRCKVSWEVSGALGTLVVGTPETQEYKGAEKIQDRRGSYFRTMACFGLLPRRLGGNPPAGRKSESLRSITVVISIRALMRIIFVSSHFWTGIADLSSVTISLLSRIDASTRSQSLPAPLNQTPTLLPHLANTPQEFSAFFFRKVKY